MKIKLLLFYIFFSIINTNAQESKQMERPIYGFYIASGLQFVNFDKLNSTFIDSRISTFENYIEKSNYGFYLRDPKHGTYTELHYSNINTYNKEEELSTQSEFKGWGFGFSFNYDLLQNKTKTIISPKIGFDINKYELSIINNNYNETDFNQILNNLAGEKTLKTDENYSIDLGVGFEQRINIYYAYIYFGFNASYSLELNRIKWNDLQGNTITSIPQISTRGFKIMFVSRIELNWDKFKVK